ncbi:two-component sensor histidine kinase, partial [Nocardia donostiensis]
MRARTTTAATAVVAVALTAAGLIVLAALRDNLVESASVQAENIAHDIVTQLEAGTALAQLQLPDPDDEPVQVVSVDGQVLAAADDLRGQGPMAGFGPYSSAEAGGRGDDADDTDDDDAD